MHRQYSGQGSFRCGGSRKKKRRTSNLAFKRGLTTKIHWASASAKFALAFRVSPGNSHDAPELRILIKSISSDDEHPFLMDKAYEDEETRNIATEQGFILVVPLKSNRRDPWDYDQELYKRRNEAERYFLRLKRFRKVFTRYDKLDSSYIAVIYFAMIFDAAIKNL